MIEVEVVLAWPERVLSRHLQLEAGATVADAIAAYAYVKHGEIFLIGAQITPLIQASTHVLANDRRERKLLLHRAEIDKLIGKVALVTGAALLSLAEPLWHGHGGVLRAALWVLVLGTAFTALRRAVRLVTRLRGRG